MGIDKPRIKFCSFSSGSSGNCYLVATNSAAILVDAGTTGKNVVSGLGKCGLMPGDIDGIFLTHEHHDHVRGLPVILKEIRKNLCEGRKDFRVYGSSGTIAATEERLFGKIELSDAKIITPSLDEIIIGDMVITPFRLSHDAAEPYGFRIDSHGKSLAIVTDTGYVTDSIYRNIKDVDFLILESNHEKNILLMGRYPYHLKTRILGDRGHLSNEAAGEALGRILENRAGIKDEPLRVLLAHLSKDNNTPEMARITVNNILFESDYMEGREYTLDVLERDIVGEVFYL